MSESYDAIDRKVLHPSVDMSTLREAGRTDFAPSELDWRSVPLRMQGQNSYRILYKGGAQCGCDSQLVRVYVWLADYKIW